MVMLKDLLCFSINQSISFRSQNVTKYYFLLFNISIYMILEQSKFIYLGEAVIPLY